MLKESFILIEFIVIVVESEFFVSVFEQLLFGRDGIIFIGGYFDDVFWKLEFSLDY